MPSASTRQFAETRTTRELIFLVRAKLAHVAHAIRWTSRNQARLAERRLASNSICEFDEAKNEIWLWRRSIQVEIADGLPRRGILGFFHSFFKLLGEDVFLVRLLEERIRELILALPFLLFEDV